MAASNLKTLADLIDHLRVKARGGNTDAEALDIQRAAIDGYQDVAQRSDWSFYYKPHYIYFSASETATATYTHSTRKLVRVSGSWPSWAQYGKVTLSDRVCEVLSRDSDTELTLDATLNPGEDVASGTVAIYRTTYALPEDWRGQWGPMDENKVVYNYVHPTDWLYYERTFPGDSNQWAWTVTKDPDNIGQWCVRIVGQPTALESIAFLYLGYPRAVRLTGQESKCRDGTLAATSGASTATGTVTAFSADMTGAVIRVTSSTTQYPTGVGFGNTFDEQKIILDVGSTTALTLDSPWTANYSGVKFVVSDPIDMPQSYWMALVRSAEHQLSILRGGDIGSAWEMFRREMLNAKANDRHAKDLVEPTRMSIGTYFRQGIVDSPVTD